MIESQEQLRNINVRMDELLFFLAFVPYITIGMLATTMFPMPGFFQAIAKGILVFACASIFYKKKWSLKFLIVAFSLSIVGILVWTATSDTGVIALTLLILGAYRIDARRIIKIYLFIIGVLLALAFICSLLDIIPNLQYIRPGSGIVRNSFGIIYPTDFAAHVFYLYLFSSYLYFKKHPISFSVLGVFATWFLIKFSDARLDALTLFGVLVLFLGIQLAGDKLLSLFRKIAPLAPLVAVGLSYYLSSHYDGAVSEYAKLNNLLSGRLSLGKQALELYGHTKFGQVIEFLGNGGSIESVRHYNFVDSSYLKIGFLFGIIFLVIFVLLMTMQAVEFARQKNHTALAVIILIAINSMIAHHLIEPFYNVFAILILADFPVKKSLPSEESQLLTEK